jgi:translation initiation factor IF-3
VRLVDPEGEQLGIKLLPEALAIARDLDLDLVEVAPGANPPVCRIMDYGKFKFDAAQRAKESRRKAVHVGIKEMKYRPKIGPGDFETKTRQVAKFLEEGHKVKITIMFRGREVFHPELGKKILDRIADEMDGMGKSESVPRLDGRNMVMVLAPDKRAKQSAASRGPGHEHGGSNGAGPRRSSTGAVPVVSGSPAGGAVPSTTGSVTNGSGSAVAASAAGGATGTETTETAEPTETAVKADTAEAGRTAETGETEPQVADVAAQDVGGQSPEPETSEGEG